MTINEVSKVRAILAQAFETQQDHLAGCSTTETAITCGECDVRRHLLWDGLSMKAHIEQQEKGHEQAVHNKEVPAD